LLVDLSDAARELALQSGDLPVRESNLELARQAAEQASEIKTRPEAWRAWMALGRAQVAIAWLLDRPAEYEKGVGSLSQAIQARPEDTALLIDRGRAYILWVRLGRGGAALLVKARNDLEQAVAKQLPPSQEAVALDWLGLLAMAASNYEEAQKKFTEAIKLISLGSVEGDLHIRAWLRAFKEQAIWDAIINPRLPPASWSLLSQVLGDRARQLKALAQDGPAALDLTLAQALIRLKASTKPDFQALIKDVDNALKLAEGPQIRTAARAETFALAGFLWKKYAEQNFMQTKEFHTGLDNWGMHYERALSEAPEYPDSFWWRMELAKAYEIDLKYRTTDKESDKWKDLYSRAEKQLKEALKTAPADPWHDAIKNQLKGLEKLKEQG
jgi:tetratricopeptide (TPR) repeat protein